MNNKFQNEIYHSIFTMTEIQAKIAICLLIEGCDLLYVICLFKAIENGGKLGHE